MVVKQGLRKTIPKTTKGWHPAIFDEKGKADVLKKNHVKWFSLKDPKRPGLSLHHGLAAGVVKNWLVLSGFLECPTAPPFLIVD